MELVKKWSSISKVTKEILSIKILTIISNIDNLIGFLPFLTEFRKEEVINSTFSYACYLGPFD